MGLIILVTASGASNWDEINSNVPTEGPREDSAIKFLNTNSLFARTILFI